MRRVERGALDSVSLLRMGAPIEWNLLAFTSVYFASCPIPFFLLDFRIPDPLMQLGCERDRSFNPRTSNK